MEKSFVGDPVLWSGLVYSPLNNQGLIFALGAVAASVGLLFEEFSADSNTAVCRRKTDSGWERLTVAFAYKSSTFVHRRDDIDMLICWLDDAPESAGPPRLILAELDRVVEVRVSDKPQTLETILPESAADDLLQRARNRESYEDTIRQLDEQIKKLQKG
jgi:hypothetical protein